MKDFKENLDDFINVGLEILAIILGLGTLILTVAALAMIFSEFLSFLS